MPRPASWLVVLCGFSLAFAQEPAKPEAQVRLRGRVTSATDGQPLAGATVEVRDWYDVVGERGVDVIAPGPRAVITAGADGTFEVPALGLEGPIVTVTAKGHASVSWREDTSTSAGRIPTRDVALPASAPLEGKVVGPDGASLLGVRVFAVEWDALDLGDHPDPLAAAADLLWGPGQYDEKNAFRYVAAGIDTGGRFRILGADAARSYVIVAASTVLGPSMIPGPVMPGLPLPDLRLDPAVAVRVRVLDEEGHPLAVNAAALPGSPRATAWDRVAEGVYALSPVGPGFHALDVTPPGHGSVHHEFTLPHDAKDFETTVLVGEGGTISGVVTDTEGRPVGGARVYIRAWDLRSRKSCQSDVRTDADGKFRARGQPEGAANLYVSARGFQAARLLHVSQPLTDVAVTLRRARAVVLRVSPPRGVRRGDSLKVATRTLDGRGPWTPVYASWDTPVMIEGVPLGRAAIRIWTPGCALYEREVTLEPGDGPASLDAARLEPARTVTVRLVDEEGFPVPGLKVVADEGDLPPVDWTEIQRTTDAEGKATIEVHVPGPVNVYVEEGAGRKGVYRKVEIPADAATTVDVEAGERK